MLCEFYNTRIFFKGQGIFLGQLGETPSGTVSERSAWQSSFLVESCLLCKPSALAKKKKILNPTFVDEVTLGKQTGLHTFSGFSKWFDI